MSCLVGLEQVQELDISRCNGVDATTVAKVIADNQTLSKLIFGGDEGRDSSGKWKDILEPAILEVGMTNANFSYKALGVGDAIIISAWLTHKDKGGISVLCLDDNNLRLAGCKALCDVLKSNTTVTSLSMTKNGFGAKSAQAIAEMLSGNGALLVLSVSSNNIGVDGGKVLAEGLRGNNTITELNIADTNLTYNGEDMSGIIILADVIKDMRARSSLNLANNNIGVCDIFPEGWTIDGAGWRDPQGNYRSTSEGPPPGSNSSGVIALANAIPDMGAMTSLNLVSNMLYAEGAKIVAEAIKVHECTPVIILVPFSCPSDFSINCCCLLLSAGYEGTFGVVFEEKRAPYQRGWESTGTGTCWKFNPY
jgi:hypothetical protein